MLPTIALVEDNEMYAAAIAHALQEEGYTIQLFTTGEALLDGEAPDYDMLILDHSLPGMSGMEVLKNVHAAHPELPVFILSGQEDVQVVVELYENGASHYVVKDEHAIVKLKHHLNGAWRVRELEAEVELLREEISDRRKYAKIVGESTAILEVLKLIQRVERTDTLVMITGASGTGKELVAQAIHANSGRKKKAYVAVNVAAIPEHLLEDELFGHERGAFTGASSKRKGKFEEAQGGTIFLDEIGEMELKLQAKMLRVLQEKKMSRLGSNKEIELDVRIITATNKNLGQLVKEGKFREDLYYRIQGFLIHMPRLTERGNDILVLARHFLNELAVKHGAGELSFNASAERRLMEHEWTGNVRELIAVVDRCVLMREGQVITASDLIFSDGI